MGVLKDTCIFIHKTDTSDKLLEFCRNCSAIKKKVIISDEILKELRPGRSLKDVEREKARNRYEVVKGAIDKNLIIEYKLQSNKEALKNFNKIREDFYAWMKRPKYLKRLIAQGEITLDEINSPGFKYRDIGECSLVAIAMTDYKKYIIVTDDKGEVYKHPHMNIFENAHEMDIKVFKYNEWEQYLKEQGVN